MNQPHLFIVDISFCCCKSYVVCVFRRLLFSSFVVVWPGQWFGHDQGASGRRMVPDLNNAQGGGFQMFVDPKHWGN